LKTYDLTEWAPKPLLMILGRLSENPDDCVLRDAVFKQLNQFLKEQGFVWHDHDPAEYCGSCFIDYPIKDLETDRLGVLHVERHDRWALIAEVEGNDD